MNTDNFFEKEEVKNLRSSYLDKLTGEISSLEKYSRESLQSEGRIPVDHTHYGTVHKIKGVGGTFRFPLVTEVAVEILKIFTVEAKSQVLYLDKNQGNSLLDLIEKMKTHIVTYRKEMGSKSSNA